MKDMGMEKIIFDKGNTLTEETYPMCETIPHFTNEAIFNQFEKAKQIFEIENVFIV